MLTANIFAFTSALAITAIPFFIVYSKEYSFEEVKGSFQYYIQEGIINTCSFASKVKSEVQDKATACVNYFST
jgi:hypothetical protein